VSTTKHVISSVSLLVFVAAGSLYSLDCYNNGHSQGRVSRVKLG